MNTSSNYNTETASLYASLGIEGTTYQAPFETLMAKVGTLKNKYVLDFGCGAGRSTRLLRTLSPDRLVGVDHNAAMIEQACSSDSKFIEFLHVSENGESLPFAQNLFDMGFSFYAYCEFSDAGKMSQATAEIYRILKPGSGFYVTTTNPGCLGADFVSFHYNKQPDVKDGDSIICHVHTNPPFTIPDTWWSLDLFDRVFQSNGFEIRERLFPLAEGDNWRDETRIAAEVIYHLVKPVSG